MRYLHIKTEAAHTVAEMVMGKASLMKVGSASSASPEEPGVGLIIKTVHKESWRAQMSKCSKGADVIGDTKAMNSAFRVRNRAVQLTHVAPMAAIQRDQDMVFRSPEA